MVQEISCSAEPAEEGHDGEAIDGGDAGVVMRGAVRGSVRDVAGVTVGHVADVEVADVQVGEAAYD